ncbi:MAG: rhodanese-like domain-containing protein [Gammaproteobacteria bacterium]|jgi:rhodanese-related sulfurtransferase|nr:rhodanese-like domain-containing protein [Gammaproteobacteria bacterium]MBT3723631.1 rhodanese-like domain-containing protein [Gammaproteobacteria bacterium]MBT4194092.1 rhodanese-like domain-containing protein [Gammaproteobacteria bacterium]MBT4451404.1 rhodanese-like domain-containing protein [Gammaproteobacteria bacterium]MBT4860022.1 rhodanese-like domain-containing protein [Gammaproteobacteria bacterium]
MYRKILTICLSVWVINVQALDVKLSPDREFVEVIHKNKLIKIQRIQDQDHKLEGGFAKTSRKCPPFCIQPMDAGENVKTIGQIEIFDFMENELLDGEGLIIDARTPAWWKRGTIPGSVNIPFNVFSQDVDDPQLIDMMKVLGARRRGDVGGFSRAMEEFGLMGGKQKNDEWDFTSAKKLILWCNGMWCGQSPRAIQGLLELGYPAEKILYYRGGMQVWQSLGLTVIVPDM